jgi:allantoin racemase
MKILAITPIHVAAEELDRRQARYRRMSPAGVELDLVNLPGDARVPRSLDTPEDIAASDRLVAQTALDAGDDVDAVLPDCVLDPGIDTIERDGGPPAHGILRLATGFLAACGWRFGAVTRNPAIGAELERRVDLYGFGRWFERVVVLDLDFEAIADHKRWARALDRAEAELAGAGVRALVNGCSAVDLNEQRALPAIDPTALALRMLGVAAASGLGAPPPVPPR